MYLTKKKPTGYVGQKDVVMANQDKKDISRLLGQRGATSVSAVESSQLTEGAISVVLLEQQRIQEMIYA